jgi:ATP-dependent Lon protease
MTTPKPRPSIVHGESRAYPVLPLRDIVVFPHMIVPLFVGREKSIRALEEVMKNDALILLATQKNASDDDPAPGFDLRGRHARQRAAAAQAARRHREGAGRGRERARVRNTPTAPNTTRRPRSRSPTPTGDKVEAEALARSVCPSSRAT